MTQNKASKGGNQGGYFGSTWQCLAYFLSLLLVFSAASPASARMASMSTYDMTMSDSSSPDALNLDTLNPDGSSLDIWSHDVANHMALHHLIADVAEQHMTERAAPQECNQDCDCCLALCSVYLPVNYVPTTFPFTTFTQVGVAKPALVNAITTLFRPPISR